MRVMANPESITLTFTPRVSNMEKCDRLSEPTLKRLTRSH